MQLEVGAARVLLKVGHFAVQFEYGAAHVLLEVAESAAQFEVVAQLGSMEEEHFEDGEAHFLLYVGHFAAAPLLKKEGLVDGEMEGLVGGGQSSVAVKLCLLTHLVIQTQQTHPVVYDKSM